MTEACGRVKRELTPCQLVERSIHKKYRKEIWNPFVAAVKRYQLIQRGDRIAVCVSGGKDSMLLAKALQLYQRIDDIPFELVFLVMNPGYSRENLRKIEENAALLEIPITVFQTDVFDAANSAGKNPCYLCAKMRRGHLYSRAQALGCNKIALGHHFSDVIETTLLGMFYGAQLQAMPPKLRSRNYPGMALIRPLYCVHEEAILAWKRYNRLEFLECACKFTEKNAPRHAGGGKRQEIKALLRQLRRNNPQIEQNIFKSIHAVWLDTFPGYKRDGEAHSFLERFEQVTQEEE